MSVGPKIMAENLNLYYGDFQALKEINLSIEEQKVTALIGPSGCGKSTFLRCVNRLNDIIPTCRIEGKLMVDGNDILTSDTDVVELRKTIGMVFQAPNPFPKTIYENVAFAPKLHGLKNKAVLDEVVETALKQAVLWDEVKDRLHKPALGLSGGQQQRLCIARALAIQPEVLLMDEPTSALDPISTLKLEELIRELKEVYTIVIVTHNMQQAARISDTTAFFLTGELIEVDDTEVIFTKPKDQRTEDYITGRFG